jgi:hypothetical protein
VEKLMDTKSNNESLEILKENQTHARLYMVRHYPYDEVLFPEHEEYEKLLLDKSNCI